MKYARIITKLAAKFEAKLAHDRFTDKSSPGTGSRGLSDAEIAKLKEDLEPSRQIDPLKEKAVQAIADYWGLDFVGEQERRRIENAINLGSQLGENLP